VYHILFADDGSEIPEVARSHQLMLQSGMLLVGAC